MTPTNKFLRMALTSKRRKAGSLLPDREPPAALHWLLYTRVEVTESTPKTTPLIITDLENISEIWTQPVTKIVHTKPNCSLTYFPRLLDTQRSCLVFLTHILGALTQASNQTKQNRKQWKGKCVYQGEGRRHQWWRPSQSQRLWKTAKIWDHEPAPCNPL